jgi:hypothetical protein
MFGISAIAQLAIDQLPFKQIIIKFRKTLSLIGTRIGVRQTQEWSQ